MTSIFMNKPKIPRQTTLVTVGISCSQWGSLLQGDQNTSYKVDATELFFFFFFETKVEHSLKAVASLPDVLSSRNLSFHSLERKGGLRDGSKEAPVARYSHFALARSRGVPSFGISRMIHQFYFILFYF